MKEDDHKGWNNGEQQTGFDADSFSNKTPQPARREPVFSGFDDEDGYEEPDRDTDFTSAYREEEAEDYPEEEFDDSLDEDEFPATAEVDNEQENVVEDDWGDPEDDDREEWQEEYRDEYEEQSAKWPLGLIAVAALALVLLAAGGYGIIQQRAANQEEIRTLRAQLATAASPAEVDANNDALREARQRNVELSMTLESMKLENRRLSDTVAGLEAQLEAQQEALSRPAPAPKPAPARSSTPPAAKPTSAPASQPAAPAQAGGDWFVNFGSYSQREMAESWAARLKPSAGRSTVTTGSKDGRTFYRVRVVGLDSKETANRIARQLERQHGLSKLWVGN